MTDNRFAFVLLESTWEQLRSPENPVTQFFRSGKAARIVQISTFSVQWRANSVSVGILYEEPAPVEEEDGSQDESDGKLLPRPSKKREKPKALK